MLGDLFNPKTTVEDIQNSGPKNMLVYLGNTFSQADLETLRRQMDKPINGTKHQLSVWINRGFITFDPATQLYHKTEEYLQSHPQPEGKA